MSTIISDGVSLNMGGRLRIERRSDGLYLVGENMLCPIDSREEGETFIREDRNRVIRRRMEQQDFAEWDTGGGLKAWQRKSSPHSHIWISFEEGALFGPPEAKRWMIGHYRDDGSQLAFIERLDFEGALAEAGVMLQGGEPRSAVVGHDPEGDEPDGCSNPGGHEWAYTGTAYGGDDERWCGEGRCYCIHCGADGDA